MHAAISIGSSVVDEVELLLVHLLVVGEDPDAEQQREEQLVALEQAQARVLVNVERVIEVDDLTALGDVLGTRRWTDGRA